MRIDAPGKPHLSYCTNIHPGETWSEVLTALGRYLPAVKERVCPNEPFGVGLRLSGRAAEEITQGGRVQAFRRWLDERGLYVFTLNGFPFGRFHGTRVKESVYRPDWLEPERLDYTDRLTQVLAALLPDDVQGSISTVPGAFRERVRSEADEWVMARRIVAHVATVARVHDASGRVIELALEPEPRCFIETTAEAVRFFEQRLFSERAEAWLCDALGVSRHGAAELLRRHLGVCVDACHAAVEFEDAVGSLSTLERAGIRVGKIQVTAGLELAVSARDPSEAARALGGFADDVYLHQVVVERAEGLSRYVDLPEALAAEGEAVEASRWRVHFHVPMFTEASPPLRTTRAFARELLAEVRRRPVSAHLEVETYTWDVLPEAWRTLPVEEAIAREIAWTLGELE